MPLWRSDTPTSIRFKINNRISTALSKADLKSLFDLFSSNARLIIYPNGDIARGRAYPVGTLIRQTSTDFYKWYAAESETTTRIAVLRFKRYDVHKDAYQTFLVDAGNLHCFQMLKQNIWDSFWCTLELDGAPPAFDIYVSHLLTGALNDITHPAMAGAGKLPDYMSGESGKKRSDIYQLLN